MIVNPDHIEAFETPALLSAWLKQHHATRTELWVKIFKKGADHRSINWEECVIEALAWGWIDGIKKTFDDDAYLQRITPRKASSTWSLKNQRHVENLIASGRMQPPGQKMVDQAKTNGSWSKAYAGQAKMEMPTDFLQALHSRPTAKAFFETLNRTNLFAIYHRLHTAKLPKTRADRMSKILAMLARQEKFHG